MNFATATHGLELARKYLRPILQVDRTLIADEVSTISWVNRATGISRDLYYPLEYQYLLDHSQYSFLLKDASFLQFFYKFDANGSLSAARLAYYPSPLRLRARGEDFLDAAEREADNEESGLFEHLYNWYEAIDERRDMPLNTSHLRFDYDPKVEVHSQSHLQYGAMQDLRIPASYFPLPLAFIDLVRPCFGVTTVIDPADLSHAANNNLGLADPDGIICARLRPAK